MAADIWSFVDLETTGNKFGLDRILEIGVVQVQDGKIINTFQKVVNPECSIPLFISELTGIKKEEVEGAPTFEDIAEEVWDLLQGTTFIAHNVQFDYGFLSAEFKRCGKQLSLPRVCTVRLSRTINPHFRRHNLDALIERYQLECPKRHRAFEDAHVLHQFFEIIQKEHGKEFLEQVLQKTSKRTLLPPHLNEKDLDRLPNKPGVYILYGDSDYPLYIGKSKQIRSRVLSHFCSSKENTKEYKIFSQVKTIDYIETAGELGALLLESELVKEMQPLHNQKLRRARQLVLLKEVEFKGYKQIEIYRGEINNDEIFSVLGIFKNVKAAKDHLYELARNYELCPNFILGRKQRSCFYKEIKMCRGACLGEENKENYNERFEQAFHSQRISSWPYSGPLLIKEAKNRETGDVFIFHNWTLIAKGKYEENFFDIHETKSINFDKDAYKILKFYLSRPFQLHPLNWKSYEQLLEKNNAEDESFQWTTPSLLMD